MLSALQWIILIIFFATVCFAFINLTRVYKKHTIPQICRWVMIANVAIVIQALLYIFLQLNWLLNGNLTSSFTDVYWLAYDYLTGIALFVITQLMYVRLNWKCSKYKIKSPL